METRWGKRFGRYEIVAELGRGAMGIVYKARDPKIDRFVAIKTISLIGHVPQEQQAYRERFFQEAQAAGRLVHPNIVTIFDVGEDPETQDPYIVMEYVAGVPLNGLIEDGKPLPLDTAMRLTQQVAEALDCAHAQGIGHRDIKPSNIMVTSDGQAKIMDFGIARMNLSHLTLPGHALGTPAYISPEQLNGDPADGRADIFSLGVILYSMVTGFRPFQGNSVITVCFKVANREPLAPTLLDPSLPRGLDAVIARAMAKNPVDRYQRGMELALDLRELLEQRVPITRGDTPASYLNPAKRFGDLPDRVAQHRESAGSFLARALTSWRMIVIWGCVSALGLVAFYRRVPAGHPATVDSAPAITKAIAVPETPPRPVEKTPTRRATQDSRLDLEIKHHFADGQISVWIDGSLKYSHALHAEIRKHLLVLHRVEGSDSQSISIPSGQHHIKVRAQSHTDTFDQRKELSGVFSSGSQRTLLVSFDGPHKDMRLVLK
jgi:serine/threonine protein kinase